MSDGDRAIDGRPPAMVIDLQQAREVRLARESIPDANCVCKDLAGRDMFKFVLYFRHDNRNWSHDLWAYSMADAEERVLSMKATLEVKGQLMGEIEA